MTIESIIAGAVWFAAVTLDEKSLIPIGTAMAIMGGVWWMGRKLQQIDDTLIHIVDRMENLDEGVHKLPCKNGEIKCKVYNEHKKEQQ